MRNKLVWTFALIFIAGFVSAYDLDYYTDRMNFPPGESRAHVINLTNNDNSSIRVNVTIPAGFTGYTSGGAGIGCSYHGSYWSCLLANNETKWVILNSTSSCTEGFTYKSQLTSNSTFSDEITFACVPDNKIVDCKIEYGHGDGNYLNEMYISNESATLFNLIRVWNIGHYLDPDEDANNATTTCTFPKHPVSTFGRVEVDHGTDHINGTFLWDSIEGGYWFRIGVLSQQISGYNTSDIYNVTCSDLTYNYEHHRVQAEFPECSLEVRTQEPFGCSIEAHPTLEGKSIVTLNNTEEYGVYDISFLRTFDNEIHTETYRQLYPGQSVAYVIDNGSTNISAFFIPSWYIQSVKPKYYTQTIDCAIGNLPPILSPIGNQTVYVNNTLTIEVNASDPNGDNITYYDNTTLFDINNQTGLINFTPNSSQVGNYSINISACDNSSCDWEVIIITVLNPTPLVDFNVTYTVNPNNFSIDINWTDASATYYIVQWSNDPNNFTNATNSSQVTDLNWTDHDANETDTRYYKVIAIQNGDTIEGGPIGCKHTYHFYSNSDTTKGRNYLALACNSSYYAEDFISSVPGQTATYITQLNRWDDVELEDYQSHPLGSSVNNFSMDLGKGYLLFTTANVSMTIAGSALLDPVEIQLYSNSDTTKGRNYMGLPYSTIDYYAENFIQNVSSATYITQLNRWDDVELEDYQSHPKSSTVNNFSMMNRGRGYLIFVTQNETNTPR